MSNPKPQLKTFLPILFSLLLVFGYYLYLHANVPAKVNFSNDTILSLTNITAGDLIIAQNSQCDSIDVSGKNLTVSNIPDGGNFTLKTATHSSAIKISPSDGTVNLTFSSDNFSQGGIVSYTLSSSTGSATANITWGVPQSNIHYTVKANGTILSAPLSSSSSEITFNYNKTLITPTTFTIAEDITAPTSFTLISPADKAVISDKRPTFSWNASSDSGSGLSKYQLYIDNTPNQDNIPSSATSIPSSADLSCGNHSWYVKAIDSADNSTSSNTMSFLIDCAGGFTPPTKPNITNANITASNTGILTLTNIPGNITQFTVSTTPDFKNTSWQDISKKDEILKKYNANDKLYIKFRTKDGGVSDVVTYTPKSSNTSTGNNTISGNTITNPITLNDGDIVKTPTNPDVYIIKYKNNKQYKRLILSPSVFKSYQHLKWTNIKIISQQQLDQYTTSNLVKETKDTIIYSLTPQGNKGERRTISTSQPYDIDSVYEINKVDRDSYKLVK
jgi:hypothetical protein